MIGSVATHVTLTLNVIAYTGLLGGGGYTMADTCMQITPTLNSWNRLYMGCMVYVLKEVKFLQHNISTETCHHLMLLTYYFPKIAVPGQLKKQSVYAYGSRLCSSTHHGDKKGGRHVICLAQTARLERSARLDRG